MIVSFTQDDAERAFRAEIADFIRRDLPADMAARNRTAVHWTREDMLGWAEILNRRGWSTIHWPEEYGGPGWTPRQRHIFEEMTFAAGAPPLNMQAITLVGPVISTFGSAEQKARHLPSIREGREFWAQGFSEPNAGSDLASLKTTALRDGDSYVINGQKIWTSQAQYADWLFLLVRTDPQAEKRAGISFILCPANAPGVTIRPIPSIDGGISLCETFLENVRVPVENLVGEAGKGWVYANFLLGNERTTTAEIPRNRQMLKRLKSLAKNHTRNGRPLSQDPAFAARIAALEVELEALEVSVQRALSETQPNGRPMASTLKLRGSEILQGLAELQVEALGPRGAIALNMAPEGILSLPGLDDAAEVTEEYLFRRAATIYGGTSEIQRSIIGKAILKLDEHASPSQDLTDDQRMLADTIRRLTNRHHGFAGRKDRLARGAAATREIWAELAETGLLAMTLSEAAGGLGSPPADIAIVLEGLGAALATEPFLSGAVLAARAVETAAGPDSEWLAGVAEGTRILALAHENAGDAARATPTDQGYVLDGAKAMVLGAPDADVLIVLAEVECAGPTLFALPADTPGISRFDYPLFDGRSASDITFTGVSLSADALLGTAGAANLGDALDLATIGLCAEALGAMEKALWITRDYTNARQQFNSPLSGFQAVQHRIADMYVDLEQARSILMRGLAALELPKGRERDLAVSATKALVGLAARRIGNAAVQLHGGIGITDEYIIGHYFKRLMVSDQLLGDRQHHLSRIAAE